MRGPFALLLLLPLLAQPAPGETPAAAPEIVASKFELFVTDAEESVAFYTALGFHVAHRKADGYTTLRSGATVIALSPVPGWLPLRWLGFLRYPPIGTEIVLYASDLPGARAALEGAGYTPGPVALQSWGDRDFRIRDPDGYYVRVSEGRAVPAGQESDPGLRPGHSPSPGCSTPRASGALRAGLTPRLRTESDSRVALLVHAGRLRQSVPAARRITMGTREEGQVARTFEAEAGAGFDVTSLVASCMESGASALLLDEAALPTAFFDLGSGLAGELLHKLGTYRIRLAAVVPDPSIHPTRFQEFLREANRGTEFRFFATREEALGWLA